MSLAKTAENSPDLAIDRAEGVYIYDVTGKPYLDLIAGVAVNNLGHAHPAIAEAVRKQMGLHAHVMVYGEFDQRPQQELAAVLTDLLPDQLSCVYLVNSGSEAVEGALKLCRKYTARKEVLSCLNGYHGSTFGALSVMGNERFKTPFGPLLPHVRQIAFNNFRDLDQISDNTAAVLVETVQGEAGVVIPEEGYLARLQQRCRAVGALLILDEIQTGFGRTGRMFGFENYDVVPDVVLFAKAMGSGFPIGAFISSEEIMATLATDPPLGHITTFGGHPVSCAAAAAGINVLRTEGIVETVNAKGQLFRDLLNHKAICEIRGVGLMLAVQLENAEQAHRTVEYCLRSGLITDRFLFADDCLRIAPPLNIEEDHIRFACSVIHQSLDKVAGSKVRSSKTS